MFLIQMWFDPFSAYGRSTDLNPGGGRGPALGIIVGVGLGTLCWLAVLWLVFR